MSTRVHIAGKTATAKAVAVARSPVGLPESLTLIIVIALVLLGAAGLHAT